MKYAYAVLIAAVVLLAGCGGGEKVKSSTEKDKPAVTATLPANLFVKEAPPAAKAVADAKKDAKEGEEIVVRGRIGGSEKGGFIEGRAEVMIVDGRLATCAEMEMDDKCVTPWDYCCETDKIAPNAAMVRVLGADGKPLSVDLKGKNGMDNTIFLVVKGKVAKSDGVNLLINATEIYVEPAAAAKPKG